jgi:carboxypeptidase PM20D1
LAGFKKKAALAALAVVVLLASVLLVRTFRFSSRQLTVPAAERLPHDEQAAAERLAAAVRLATVSQQERSNIDHAPFVELHTLIAESFPKTHQALSRETVSKYSLLYIWQGSDPSLEPLLLMAHLDVVPIAAGTEDEWVHPPFSGAIADSYVWGRGAIDDKVSVMATLEAVELLIARSFKPQRTVMLAFGHDEEIGGRDGAKAVAARLSQRGLRLHMVVDEGGVVVMPGIVAGIDKPVALIGIAEKGYASMELTAKAKGGHSSMPPKSTAVGILARAVQRVESRPMPASISGPVALQLDHIGPEMKFGMRMALANRWLFGGVIEKLFARKPPTNAMLRTTTAFTMLEGSIKENVLPPEAKAVVNFRIKPGDTVARVKYHVEQVVADPRVSIRVLEGASDPPPVSSIETPAYAAIQRTVHEVLPEAVVAPSLVIAMTDSRHYNSVCDNVYRFMPVRIGPEDIARIHGTNERMGIGNYAEVVQFYARLIQNVAGGDN